MNFRRREFNYLLIGGILFLFLISVFQSLNYYRCRKAHAVYANQIKEIMSALMSTEEISLSHSGHIINFVNIELVGSEITKDAGLGPRLWLFIDELACDACQESEAIFTSEVAAQFGHHLVGAIVKASNNRYIKNFIRMNRINFDVYSCKDNSVFVANKIYNTPLLLLVDQENKVIAGHVPVAGQPQFSRAFHEFTKKYFEAITSTALR